MATSVARIRRDQGKRQQARDLLAPGHGWFAEGFDTLDLKEPRPCSTRWRNNSSCAGSQHGERATGAGLAFGMMD